MDKQIRLLFLLLSLLKKKKKLEGVGEKSKSNLIEEQQKLQQQKAVWSSELHGAGHTLHQPTEAFEEQKTKRPCSYPFSRLFFSHFGDLFGDFFVVLVVWVLVFCSLRYSSHFEEGLSFEPSRFRSFRS